MIRRFWFLLLLSVWFSVSGYAQWCGYHYFWKYGGIFTTGKDTIFGDSGRSGIAVDPDDRIWITSTGPQKADSVFVADSNKYIYTYPVYVYNADGTPAPFSPIKLIDTPGLKNKVFSRNKTGITSEYISGNILICDNNELIRIDYKTGRGMNRAQFTSQDNSGLCRPATDAVGSIFVSFMQPDHPVIGLNPDFTVNMTAVKSLSGTGVVTDVSRDGNIIYAHRSGAACTYVYSRPSEFDPFVLRDTLFKGFRIEAGSFSRDGLLYLSCGSFCNPPLSDSTIPGIFYPQAITGTYYGINLKTRKIEDSLKWRFIRPGSVMERNCGIAFSTSGKTAYLISYGGSYYPAVQKYVASIIDGVSRENGTLPDDYSLSQNYPNPFNPSTVIRYSNASEGFVTLKVYDILGKEAAVLVNELQSPGNYSIEFNTDGLSSGIYLYQLNVNGVILSRKMVVTK